MHGNLSRNKFGHRLWCVRDVAFAASVTLSFIAATKVDHSQAPRNASRRHRLEWHFPEAALQSRPVSSIPRPESRRGSATASLGVQSPGASSGASSCWRARWRRRPGDASAHRREKSRNRRDDVAGPRAPPLPPHSRQVAATPASVGTAPVVRFLALSLVMCSCLASFSAVVLSDEVSARDCRHDTTKPRFCHETTKHQLPLPRRRCPAARRLSPPQQQARWPSTRAWTVFP